MQDNASHPLSDKIQDFWARQAVNSLAQSEKALRQLGRDAAVGHDEVQDRLTRLKEFRRKKRPANNDLTDDQRQVVSRIVRDISIVVQADSEPQIFGDFKFLPGRTLGQDYYAHEAIPLAGTRVLALVIEHLIQEQKRQTIRLSSAIEAVARELVCTTKQIHSIHAVGQFYTKFLQLPVPCGALWLLGKHHTQFGRLLSGQSARFANKCFAEAPNFVAKSTKYSATVVGAIIYTAQCRKVPISKESRLYEIIQTECDGSPGLAEKAGWPMNDSVGNSFAQLPDFRDSGNSSVDDTLRNAVTNDSAAATMNELTRSLSLPQVLLVSEMLLYNVKLYFERLCPTMTFSGDQLLISSDGTERRNDLCTNFDSYCFTATMLKDKGLHDGFGRALSNAFDLVPGILLSYHPRTLPCFFEVLIHFIQCGLDDVASVLSRFVRSMSARLDVTDTLWVQICRLIGQLEPCSALESMARAWSCVANTVDAKIGASHRLAVSVRLDYIKRTITDHVQEEQMLRAILPRSGEKPAQSTPRVMLNLAHNLDRQCRHEESQMVALRVRSLLEECEMYSGRTAEAIESLKVISRSLFNQGKTLEAEFWMRKAMEMIVIHWGRDHPWIVEFTTVLEGWYRAWGHGDTIALQIEIDNLMIGSRTESDHFRGVPQLG